MLICRANFSTKEVEGLLEVVQINSRNLWRMQGLWSYTARMEAVVVLTQLVEQPPSNTKLRRQPPSNSGTTSRSSNYRQ